MKYIRLNFLFIFILCLVSCKTLPDCNKLLSEMKDNLNAGNISTVKKLNDSARIICSDDLPMLRKADSLSQIAERIGIDFSLDEGEVITRLGTRIDSFSPADREEWERKGWLEYRLIDGEKRYFNRAVSNLVLIKDFYSNKGSAYQNEVSDPEILFRMEHAGEVIRATSGNDSPVVPVDFKITYNLTVDADAVPDGEMVRCWLPWPRSDNQRQKIVRLISTSEPGYFISPDSALHSTMYMEKAARKGLPVAFQVVFSYQSLASYSDPEKIVIKPYDKSSEIYKKNTAQQLPQISFTENVKLLADSITAGTEDPAIIVRKIYLWFKENIPWTGALEYSIMPDIPEYVIINRRGDCGMQTFLFMSMLRYKGIPVKWQSGWMVPPGAENLHDWCEVYYEGIGWVPADVSYDLLPGNNKALREFYLSGIDSYRLIVNEGVAGRLHPGKIHLRSEPYDFQRGEVEWTGGNLYFDKWDYEIEIEYVK